MSRLLAVIDLSSVTDGLSEVKVAVLALAALVIAAGLAIYAIPFGLRMAKKLFKIGSN